MGPSIEKEVVTEASWSAKRKMLPREMIANYYSLKGLQQLTGEPNERFNAVVVSELIGNSIDICDEKYEEQQSQVTNIELCVEKIAVDFIRITVKDNGYGWEQENVSKICDTTHFYSSRSLYKRVTIGLVGHASKILQGGVDAFAKACHKNYGQSPIVIISKGKRYDIDITYDGKEALVNPRVSETEIDDTWTSKVSVILPAYRTEWLTDEPYLEKFNQFVVANPHVNFTYKGLKIQKHYPKLADLKVTFRESILDFDLETFVERAIAEGTTETEKFTTGFRDCSKLQVKDLPKKLSEFSPEQRKQLYSRMLEHVKNAGKQSTATVLEPLALKEHLLNRIDQVFPSIASTEWNSKYKLQKDVAHYNGQEIPFLVEVAVKAYNGVGKRCILVAINRGPRPDDRILDYIYGDVVKSKQLRNITGVLEYNGITESDPVTVWIHLISPNVPYLDLGKTQIEVRPFAAYVAKAVFDASGFYRSLKKKYIRSSQDKTNDESIANGTATQKEKVFQELPIVVDEESSHGKYKFPVRNAWYKLRERFEKNGWSDLVPQYDPYFTPTLTEQFRREYPNGKMILANMLKERSGSLQEPRTKSIIPIDTENVENYQLPKWKYNKILYIEKNGFTGLLVENNFHSMFDLAVMAGRGEGSFGARDILKKIKKLAKESGQEMALFTVHDADWYGLGISATFRHGSRNVPGHNLDITDLGLTISDAEKWGLTPEKVPWPKNKDGSYRMIPEKISKYNSKEIEEITNAGMDKDGNKLLNRIELNAFTPEKFLEWLTVKLEEHNCKTKVRPPDEIVKAESQQAAENILEERIEDEIWHCLGGKDHFMKAAKDSLKNTWRGTEKDVDRIDVKESMDNQLASFPIEGWNDILGKDVEQKINANIATSEKQIIFEQLRKAVAKEAKGYF